MTDALAVPATPVASVSRAVTTTSPGVAYVCVLVNVSGEPPMSVRPSVPSPQVTNRLHEPLSWSGSDAMPRCSP